MSGSGTCHFSVGALRAIAWFCHHSLPSATRHSDPISGCSFGVPEWAEHKGCLLVLHHLAKANIPLPCEIIGNIKCDCISRVPEKNNSCCCQWMSVPFSSLAFMKLIPLLRTAARLFHLHIRTQNNRSLVTSFRDLTFTKMYHMLKMW